MFQTGKRNNAFFVLSGLMALAGTPLHRLHWSLSRCLSLSDALSESYLLTCPFLSWMRTIRTYRTVGMTVQKFIFCPSYNLLFFVVSFTREKRRKKVASVRTYPRWQGWRKGEHSNISNKCGPGSDPGVDTIWKVFSRLFFFFCPHAKNQHRWQKLNGCRRSE